MMSKPFESSAASEALLSRLKDKISTSQEWGITERLVLDALSNDKVSAKIREINIRNYEIAALLAEGKVCLDIACGSGYGTEILSKRGALSVTGVDLCPEAIDYARMRHCADNVEYIVSDVFQYSPNHSYDLVVSFETIEHLKNPFEYLNHLARLTKPGGLLAFSVPLGETRHLDPFHLHKFNEKEVLSMLQGSCFDVLLKREDVISLTLPELISWANAYPDNPRPSLINLLTSKRGLHLAATLLLHQKVRFSQFLVIARRHGE